MFRYLPLAAWFVLAFGCNQQKPTKVEVEPPQVKEPAKLDPKVVKESDPKESGPLFTADSSQAQARYDATMLMALNQVADKKYPEALLTLENLQSIHNTEQVKAEVERVRLLLTQQQAAQQTASDIQAILKDGDADQASKLATDALAQFGAGDGAPQLVLLKQQADALRAQGFEDVNERKSFFVKQAEGALKDQNLRAAAVAFGQALEIGEDAVLKAKYSEIQSRLDQYDNGRQKGGELRQDPGMLEDALVFYNDAAKAWDTPEIRQDIADTHLALTRRRDRVAVADFEARGEIGIPLAGRTLAEELLPNFRVKYDVVERAQLDKVIQELNLQADDLADNDAGRRDLAQLARVRFLVLGSVTRVGGVTVNARLVDATTGVVMQTARVSAPTPEKLLPLLPQVAQVLLMSDEEKLAFEAKQALEQVAVAEAPKVIPPAPEPLAANVPPPPPVIAGNPQPPQLGQINPQDLEQLPQQVDGGVQPPIAMPVGPDPFRDRLLAITLQVGDNFFLRGRYGDALRQYEIALAIAPERPDLLIRVERCRAFLTPAPVVVIPPVPPPVIYYRPRVAVLPFIVRPVLPGFGGWVSDRFAWQLTSRYDVVDRGELFWYMGRLGMSVRDVLYNPYARISLARAMGVRFFVFGYVDQVASFNVRTYMIDAEAGYRIGNGFIHVHDPYELKLRMGELVHQTICDPRDRPLLVQQGTEFEGWLVEGRRHLGLGQFALTIQFARRGLARNPNHAGFLTLLRDAEAGERRVALDVSRRNDFGLMQKKLVNARVEQEVLTRQLEAARKKAAQEAALRDAAQDKLREERRDRAYDQLVAQARQAMRQEQYGQAVRHWESALAMKSSDAGFRELAEAKAKAQQAANQRDAKELAEKDAKRKQKEADDIAKARAQVEKERKDREAEELARKKSQEGRDQAAHDKLIAAAKKNLADQKYDAAIASAQSALQLVNSPEGRQLLQQAIDKQGQAKQSAQERADLDKKLADEKAKREGEAKQKQDAYAQAFQQGQKALADKQYDNAIARFNEALKVQRTDAALNGLRQAEQAQSRDRAQADAETKKKADEQKRQGQVDQLLAQGQKQLDAQQFDPAIKTLTEAKKLAPTNVDVLAALSKAEAGRSRQQADQKTAQEGQTKLKTLIKQAQGDIAAKRYDEAIANLNEALRINANDPTVQSLLKQARDGKASASAADTEDKEYQKLLSQGQQALSAKQYDVAIQAFQGALKLKPRDATVTALLKKAQDGKDDAATSAKKQQEDKDKAAQVQKLVQQGRAALAQKNLTAAAQALAAAAKLDPKDAEVVKAQQDLRKAQDDAQASAADAKKTEAQVQKLVQQGKAALAQKNLAAAAQALNAAAKLDPKDPDVQRALADLQKAQTAEADAKKNDAQVQQLVQQGKAALAQKNLAAAAQALNAAAKLDPKDPEVQRALADLQKAQNAAQADADQAKRRADAQALVQKAQGALAQKQYDAAIQLLNQADKLTPNDKQVDALLRQAQALRKEADAADAKKKDDDKRRQAYAQSMKQGQAAMQTRRFDDAVRAFSDALRQQPGDIAASQSLAAAQKALQDSKVPPKKDPPKVDPPKKDPPKVDPPKVDNNQAQFNQHMTNGQRLLAAKKFGAAAQEFEAALRLMPNNAQARQLLQQARQGK